MRLELIRNRRWYTLAALAILACLAMAAVSQLSRTAGAAPPGAPDGSLDLAMEVFASGLDQPVSIANAGNGDSRLFVAERPGQIMVVLQNGTVLGTPFLDITDRVDDSQSEEGLLGLAFHPDYENNGYFYVNYTNTGGNDIRRTRISRFTVTGDPNVADPDSEVVLLTVTQPFGNHNAGDIHFGPDSYLYIPLGDGGNFGDEPYNNAQTYTTLLGKISRIDVDQGPGAPPDCVGAGVGNYTIPASNPRIDGPGDDCDEIWAAGLRNPWRSSFDRATGDFYLGDVGQGAWEEIDFQPSASTGDENYGWRCYEGNHTYNTSGCGPANSYDGPVFEYANDSQTCAVIGGYVYRGGQFPDMYGRYFLADYCAGDLWDLVPGSWAATFHNSVPGAGFGISSFGESSDGELYVAKESNGIVYHLVENTQATLTPSPSPTTTPTPTATPTCAPTPTPQPTATPGGPPLTEDHYLPVLLKQEVSYCW